jgi:hypothetical protein
MLARRRVLSRPRVLTWREVLTCHEVLVRREMLTWREVLTCSEVLAGRDVQASLAVLTRAGVPSGTGALPDPHGAGPQRAPQLAGAWQISAVPRAQREVLSVRRQIAARMTGGAFGRGRQIGAREPVVRVRPGRLLLRIQPGPCQPLGQQDELVTAPLADRSERHPIPGQVQRDLVGLPRLIPAADSVYGQH